MQYEAEIEYFKKYETYRNTQKPFGKIVTSLESLKKVSSNSSSVSDSDSKPSKSRGGRMVITLEELGNESEFVPNGSFMINRK